MMKAAHDEKSIGKFKHAFLEIYEIQNHEKSFEKSENISLNVPFIAVNAISSKNYE